MSDKIIDFLSAAKEEGEGPLPIELDATLANLQMASDDFVKDYFHSMMIYIEELLVIKSIVESRKNPNLFRHLTKNLNEVHLKKLSKIALHLVFERVKEVVDETYDLITPSPECIEKAHALIDIIKNLDIDYVSEAKRLSTASTDLRRIADQFILKHLGKDYEQLMFERLAVLSEADIDALMGVENMKFINNK